MDLNQRGSRQGCAGGGWPKGTRPLGTNARDHALQCYPEAIKLGSQFSTHPAIYSKKEDYQEHHGSVSKLNDQKPNWGKCRLPKATTPEFFLSFPMMYVCMSYGCMLAFMHVMVHMWRSKDKGEVFPSPSTLFKTESLVRSCVSQLSWHASFSSLLSQTRILLHSCMPLGSLLSHTLILLCPWKPLGSLVSQTPILL